MIWTSERLNIMLWRFTADRNNELHVIIDWLRKWTNWTESRSLIRFVLPTLKDETWLYLLPHLGLFLKNFSLSCGPTFFVLFRTPTRGGTKTQKVQEKTSEMNVSQRDLIRVKISASNSKNSRSYSIFGKVGKKFHSEQQIFLSGAAYEVAENREVLPESR